MSISVDFLRYDLNKVIEPWNGILQGNQGKVPYKLMAAYLSDIRRSGDIHEFRIKSHRNSTAIVFEISIKIAGDKGFTNVKVPVETFRYPWTKGRDTRSRARKQRDADNLEPTQS